MEERKKLLELKGAGVEQKRAEKNNTTFIVRMRKVGT